MQDPPRRGFPNPPVDTLAPRMYTFLMKSRVLRHCMFRFTRSAVLTLAALVVFIVAADTAHAELPRELLGVTLGEPAENYADYYWSNSAAKLRDKPFLTEATIRRAQFPGIRGGSLAWGNCANPGTLIEMKLKFEDRERDLYKKLYSIYKKNWGEPDEWQGNAFNTIQSWKWMVRDGDERINIVLTWSESKDMRPGVSIKMTMRTLWEEEYACYHEQLDEHRPQDFDTTPAEALDLSRYVPAPPDATP